ncbi:twin-arginine translocase subunit TatC [Candidatus Gromoviella agglomerans]|uniref:twin-arginine translocase subunit TatC n=1 Tax=Candidatus Gromoviella agglomerans TaxID=2806609 RepID=UPI003B75C3E9|nr:Sec-independent protein translocase protein TatC [Candidatus Gromoviella agglomerans]
MYFLIPHIKEIRKRVILCLIHFSIFSSIGYYFSQDIIKIIVFPLQTSKIVFTSLPEGFIIHIKIAIYFGALASCPFSIYHIWKFISIGLLKNEKRIAKYCCIFAPILFLCGVLFAYWISQTTWHFLSSFQFHSENFDLIFLPKLSEYFNTMKNFLIFFGISFQTPLILFVLMDMRFVSVFQMKKFRRFFIMITTIFSAIFAPPDIISALIMIVISQISYEIVVLIFSCKRKMQSTLHNIKNK